MSTAPDHQPGSDPRPTDWKRLAAGLVGLFLGLAIIAIGLRML